MKSKIKLLLIICMVALLLPACGTKKISVKEKTSSKKHAQKNNENNNENVDEDYDEYEDETSKFIGTWSYDEFSEQITFYSDGSYKWRYPNDEKSGEGIWTVSNGKISLDNGPYYEYSIKLNTLTIIQSEKEIWIYYKKTK